MSITETVNSLREYFNSGVTLNLKTREQILKKLKQSIIRHEKEIFDALNQDLGKSETESYMSEVGLVLSEISYCLKHFKKWAKPKKVASPLAQFPSKSFMLYEPRGVVLIMSPWNYPFMLTLEPLIGAICAGNCCVLKPSNYSPAVSAVIRKIVSECFDANHVHVVLGGREQNQELLDQRFDYIFFTGGVNVGKIVAEKASKFLTPITLELGGKSPLIIEKSANIKLAAKRVAFGKYLNCGQTCVAPDYCLVDNSIKQEFIDCVKVEIVKMFGQKPLENNQYGKIINQKHFDRIMGLIDPEKVVIGGKGDSKLQKIEPTVLDNVTLSDAVMQEEIFGPILPIIGFDNLNQAKDIIKKFEKPLALYLFTTNKKVEREILSTISFGGGCINDTIIHIATSRMPFGGVGLSGLGNYHGKFSFETFSHLKPIVKKSNKIDLPMRYQPYTKKNDKIIRLFLK